MSRQSIDDLERAFDADIERRRRLAKYEDDRNVKLLEKSRIYEEEQKRKELIRKKESEKEYENRLCCICKIKLTDEEKNAYPKYKVKVCNKCRTNNVLNRSCRICGDRLETKYRNNSFTVCKVCITKGHSQERSEFIFLD